MSKFKHTPGSWETNPLHFSDSIRIFSGAKYLGSIGNSDDDQEITKANARLMASAPDLLEALQRIVTGIPEHRDGAYFTDCYAEDGTQLSPESHNPVDIINSIVGVAMAAILKATGDL